MSLTVNAKSYDFDTSRSPDSVRYNGPSNTFSVKDYIDAWRKAPIATSLTDGKGRAFAKLTRTVTDGTDDVGDVILKVEISAPVGAATAELEACITDVATWLATSSADDMLLSHDINQ
jgi:hypothetical protein